MVFHVIPSLHLRPSNMLRFGEVFVLGTVFQVISSQGPPQPPPFLANLPEECLSPPQGVKPHECCEIPPLIDERKLAACGIEKPKEGEPQFNKPGPPDCSKSQCLLKNEDLMDENDKIKYPELSTFLDNWVETNPQFKEAVESSKEQCLKEGGPPGPFQICEADRFFFCMTGNIFTKCPTWKDSDGCKKVKDHMEKCHKYLINPAK